MHGIGSPRDAAAELAEWRSALAEGAREAGYAEAISGLTGGWAVDTSYAYYTDLYARDKNGPQAQGDEEVELDAFEGEMLVALLREFVEREAAKPENRGNRKLARASAQLSPEASAQAQGVVGAARHAIDACSLVGALPVVRTLAHMGSARTILRTWSQPGRYLSRRAEGGTVDADGQPAPLDRRIRRKVLDCLDPSRPAVVVAHSLGTVVALETLADDYPGPVPLFVTLGSPIATRGVIWPWLRPSPPATPECVGRWLDFSDADDLVVPHHGFADAVLPNASGVRPHTERLASRRLWVHDATTYLRRPEVAGRVMEALAAASVAP